MTRKKKIEKKRTFNKKYIIGFCCIAAAAVLAVAAFFGVKAWQDSRPLLEVDGHQIGKEEYSWAMYAARDDILSQHAASGISPIQWDVETELGMPYEMVAERAVEILQEFYAVMSLAEERGYLEDGTFAALKAEQEEGNRQREEAIAAGEIITGLSHFDLQQYIDYRISGLRRQFCDDETNPEMTVSESDILQRYEEDKARLYAMEDTLELHYVQISAEDTAAMEEAVGQLRQAAADCGSLQEAVAENPQLQEYYQELTLEGENYGSYSRVYEDILAYCESLQTGELSEVICVGSEIYLIECVQRIENGFQPLDSVRSVVKSAIQKSRYDDLIAQRTGEMEAEYDAARLYRYTAEKLG